MTEQKWTTVKLKVPVGMADQLEGYDMEVRPPKIGEEYFSHLSGKVRTASASLVSKKIVLVPKKEQSEEPKLVINLVGNDADKMMVGITEKYLKDRKCFLSSVTPHGDGSVSIKLTPTGEPDQTVATNEHVLVEDVDYCVKNEGDEPTEEFDGHDLYHYYHSGVHGSFGSDVQSDEKAVQHPIPGEWYDWKGHILYCCGRDPDGEGVLLDVFYVVYYASDISPNHLVNLPDCTGFDWKPPTPWKAPEWMKPGWTARDGGEWRWYSREPLWVWGLWKIPSGSVCIIDKFANWTPPHGPEVPDKDTLTKVH